MNSKQRLRLLLHDENNNDNDTTFLEEGEEGTEVMNGVPPVDVSRLLLDYSILSTDNNGSIVAILHYDERQLHQPQPSTQTQQMKSSGYNSNSSNKDEENTPNTQKKVNKTKKNKDSNSSWVYTTKDVMIEFIAPFHEGFGCTDASSDDNDESGGVQESLSRTPCKKQLSGQQLSDDDKRGSGNKSGTDLSPRRHRNNQAASASSCGLIDIEEAIANLIAPFYTIEDGVSQELECIISCGID